MRTWRNMIGPREVTATAIATPISTGASTTTASSARARSIAALDDAADPGELRFLHVEQRQAGDRSDVDARTGDVGEPRCHQERDSRALEVPGESAQVVLRHVGPRGDGHGVGAGLAQHVDDVVAVTHDRDTLDGVTARTVDAGRGDVQAGMRLATDRPDQLSDRALETDDDDLLHAAAATAEVVEGLASAPVRRPATGPWPEADATSTTR